MYGNKGRKERSDFSAVSRSITYFFLLSMRLFGLCNFQNAHRKDTPFFAKISYASIIYDPRNVYTDLCTDNRHNKKKKKKRKLPATTNVHSLSAHYICDSKALARRCWSRWWWRWLRCRCSGRSGHFLVTFSIAFSFPVLLHFAFSLTLALLELQQHPRRTWRTDPSPVGGQNERRWWREGGWRILGDGMRGRRTTGHRRRLRCRQQVSSDLKLGSLR